MQLHYDLWNRKKAYKLKGYNNDITHILPGIGTKT